MSLLEVIIASTMLTMLLGSVSMVLRTGRLAWEAHEGDYVRVEAAHSTVRHILRSIRQAQRVLAVSAAADMSGSLALEMPGGEIRVWDHDSATNQVNFGLNAADSLLADEITELNFQAFQADGVTPAVTPDEVQCLLITVGVQLDRDTGSSQTVSSWGWIRAW